MKGCNDDLGYLDLKQALDVRSIYWPRMTTDVQAHIKRCKKCLRFKAKPTKEPLHPISTTYPLQLVYMDYLTT